MTRLWIDWCDHKAAALACRRWHYSRSMPAAKTVKFGVWEDGRFVGVVIFSRGASPQIGKPYGLGHTEICELTRVALRAHATPVSRIVAITLRKLRAFGPGLRLVISYAAAEHGHHGGIYQAGNWIYEGPKKSHEFRLFGKRIHAKSIHSRYGAGSQRLVWLRRNIDPHAEKITGLIRHKYLMPLDDGMRGRVRHLARPYPKRGKQAMAGTTPHSGGAAPTPTLHRDPT